MTHTADDGSRCLQHCSVLSLQDAAVPDIIRQCCHPEQICLDMARVEAEERPGPGILTSPSCQIQLHSGVRSETQDQHSRPVLLTVKQCFYLQARILLC